MDGDDGGQSAPILKSGYLVKRGQNRKNWNRRWFLLRSDGSLSYYTSEKKPTFLGGMEVSQSFVQSCPDKNGHSFCFVVANERRQLYVSAADEKEKEEWLVELSTLSKPGPMSGSLYSKTRKFSSGSAVSRLPKRNTSKDVKPTENWQATLSDFPTTTTSSKEDLVRRVTVVEQNREAKECLSKTQKPRPTDRAYSPLKLRPYRASDRQNQNRRKMSVPPEELSSNEARTLSKRSEQGTPRRSPTMTSPPIATVRSSPNVSAPSPYAGSPSSPPFLQTGNIRSHTPNSSPMIQYARRTSPTGSSGPNEPPNLLQRSLSKRASSKKSRNGSRLERSTSFDSSLDPSRDEAGIRKSQSTPRFGTFVARNVASDEEKGEKVDTPVKSPKESPKLKGALVSPLLKRIGTTHPKKKRHTGIGSPDSCPGVTEETSPLTGGNRVTSSSPPKDVLSSSPSSPFQSTSPSPPHPESPVVAGSFQTDEVFEGYVRSNPREIRKSGYAVYAPVWESESVPFSMTQTLKPKGKSAPQKTTSHFSSSSSLSSPTSSYDSRRSKLRTKISNEEPVIEGVLCERKGEKKLRRWCVLFPCGEFFCYRNQQVRRSKAQPEFSLLISAECTVEIDRDNTLSFCISSQGTSYIYEAKSDSEISEWLEGFKSVKKPKKSPLPTSTSLPTSGTAPAPSSSEERKEKAKSKIVFKKTPSDSNIQVGESTLASHLEEGSQILSVSASSLKSDSVSRRLFDILKESSECPIEELKQFFERKDVDALNRPVQEVGQTFLHACIERDSFELVECLVKKGVNLRVTDPEGTSPLHFCKSVAILKLLLDSDPKMDINVADINNTTAFAQLLTIREMDEATFMMLIGRGADIHRRNVRLESPLHFAARFGSERVVELLLERRSNPNAQNDKGMTPLHYAMMAHREIIASCLIAHGADPFIQAHDGQSAREFGVMSEIWENGKAKTGFSLLVGQPLHSLFKLLKNENEEYLRVFCLTYHTFTSDEEILEFVKGELNIERPPGMEDQEFFAGLLNPMRVSIVRLVLWWVRIRFFDLRFPLSTTLVREMLSIVDELCCSISEQAGGATVEQIATLAGTTMDDCSPIPKDHPLRMNLRELYNKACLNRSPRTRTTTCGQKKNSPFSNWVKGIRGKKNEAEDSNSNSIPATKGEEEDSSDYLVFPESGPLSPSPPPSPSAISEDGPAVPMIPSEEFNVIVQDASLIIISQLVGTLKTILLKWCFPNPCRTIETYESYLASSPIRSLDLRVMKPAKIARYLTLLHFELIHAINPIELLEPKWTETPERFTNLRRYIDHFNTLSRWVAWTILDPLFSKDRAAMLTKWVLVADECRLIQNYCALVSILGGLLSTPVHRMKRTFAGVSKATMATFGELKQVMDPRGSSSAYRKLLAAAEGPCVPYMGIIMQDVTFISDGNPDYLGNKEDGQVNFSKRKQIYNAISPILKFQHQGYEFVSMSGSGSGNLPRGMSEEETLRRGKLPSESLYFLSLELHTEKELDILSLEREPRE